MKYVWKNQYCSPPHFLELYLHTFVENVCNSIRMATLTPLLSCFGFVSVSSASKIIPCGLWLVPAVQDQEQPKHSLGSGVCLLGCQAVS